MTDVIELVQATTREFCREFLQHPYLCYTEHGQHARFFGQLHDAIPADERVTTWRGQQVCVVQKEYPTAGNLGKPRRQHWDIAVIGTPPAGLLPEEAPGSYDYLRLAAAVEFGLNADRAHLQDDIERLSHPDANLEHGLVVHLYRLSTPGARLSNRDGSPLSKQLLTPDGVAALVAGTPVEAFLAVYDGTGTRESGLWEIGRGVVRRVV